MNVVFFILLFIFSNIGWCSGVYPSVNINFLTQPPRTMYYGETLRLPVVLNFYALSHYMVWENLAGGRLELVSGYCPSIPAAEGYFYQGSCYMNLVLNGDAVGRRFTGSLVYRVRGWDGHHPHKIDWDWPITSAPLDIKVIPHCPSMLVAPMQQATANQSFRLSLNSFVAHREENLLANTPAQLDVQPLVQDGLSFDPATASLVGKPTRLGMYAFTVGAHNSSCRAEPVTVTVQVNANSADTPKFKQDISLLGGFPKQKYSMNLTDLIEATPQLMVSNQVQFRIKPDVNNAEWLSISPSEPTKLQGTIPALSAGQTAYVTLIASTNTGGDSTPMQLALPIAYDKSQQPSLKPFTIEKTAGETLQFDLSPYVTSPSGEPFELFIDKVEPLASWLTHDKNSLTGTIPLNAVGQLYQITFRVSDSVGGSSKALTVPLQVAINKDKTPRFKSGLMLPIAVPGQSYHFDFHKENTVTPEDIPYEVHFAAEHPHPGWIDIKHNQLIANEVPLIKSRAVTLYLQVKNVPGGSSELIKINLALANNKDVTEDDADIHG